MKQNQLVNVCIFLFSLLLAFLLGEIVLRFYGYMSNTDLTLYEKELRNSNRLPLEIFTLDDIVLRQKLKPNAQAIATTSDFSVLYKINSKGLRDKEYDFTKEPQITRLLAFGDSNVFGEGVSYGKRFTDIPEEELSNIEILNFGVPGYGLDQALVLFAQEGLKYDFDYVVLFITANNAKRNFTGTAWKNDSYLGSNLGTVYLKKNDRFFQKSISKSYLLSYIRYNIQLLVLKNSFEMQDKKIWYRAKEFNETEENGFEKKTIEIIRKFESLAKSKKAGTIIIKIDRTNHFQNVRNETNVSYYDFAKILKEQRKRESLTFVYDPHYNQKTHRLIGENFKEIVIKTTKQ